MTDRKRKLYERYFARKLNDYLARNPVENPGIVQTRISAATAVYLAVRQAAQPPAVALDRALGILFADFTGDTEIL